ncbi:PAS domain S-box protein [Okeania sp. SIO2B3]|uniref:PAS domain-containing sensor histidine kinase n=1 Tax=Okeania sp. SIO2B3 TaxID=2607784 RepID=UPI0013C05CCB|nr:PAS domain S-box protein [Okeania sp. SIO2B3]NET40480.1 PAS domain S-box protein [Okeania sp. SIO2B3]
MKSDVNSLRTCQKQLVDLQNENAILQERLYQLEQILDILPESLICQDLTNQEIFYSNHAFQQQSHENQTKISELSRITNDKHPVEKTTQIKLNDNTEERYLAIHQIPLRNSQEKISYLVTFSQDITELKQLQHSQQLLLSIIDRLPQMIFWKDRNSVFLGCNHHAAQICGFSSPTEIIGKNDYDLPSTTEESDWYRECDLRIMETNTPEFNIIETLHRQDGSQAWLNTNKVPLHDQEGNVTGIVVSIEDITEKKHTEAQLQEVTARWQRIAASTPGLFYQYCQCPTDPTGKFTFLSDGCYDIYELDPEVALQNNSMLWELVHPDDLPIVQQSKTQAFTLEAVWQTEYRITTPSGKLKWLQATAMPCKQKDGNVYWDGIILDTTELKKTEVALRQSKEKLRYFFEKSPLAAIEWDADFRVVDWNHTAEKIFGYSKAEVFGKSNSEFNLVSPSAQDDVDLVIQKLLAGTGGTFSINENMTKTGKIIICEWHNFAFYDDDRQLISIFTMAHDVTERQKIQSELVEQRQLLRTIVDTLPQAIFWKDCNSIYKGCNSTFLREINHQPCSEIVGNTDYNLALSEEEAKLEQQSDREIMLSGKPQMHLVEQRQLPNGKQVWLDTCKVPLVDENGRIFGILGTYADITERKRVEEQLKQQMMAIEAAIDGIAILADGEHYSYINHAHLQILGYDNAEELLGKSWHILYEQEELERIKKEAFPVIDRQGFWRGEYVAKRKDGTRFEQEIALTMTDVGLIYICRDISDRKQAEAKIKESYNLLNGVINSTTDLIFAKNLQGQFLLVNSAFAESFDQSVDDLLGKDDTVILPLEVVREIRNTDRQTINSGTSKDYEEVVPIQGQLRTLLATKTPFQDAEGNIIGIVGMTRDITELKLTEQLLREKVQREQLFNQIISQIRQSLDIETILNTTLNRIRELMQTDRCLFSWYCTDAEEPYWYISNVSQLPGLSDIPKKYPTSILGSIYRKALHLEVIKVVDTDLEPDRTFQQLLKSLKIQSFLSVPFQKTSGQIGALICNNHTQARHWSDTEISLLQAVVEQLDIALTQAEFYNQSRSKTRELETTLKKLKRTQAQMIQNEKMSSLGQLVAGVAHEINNPVSFIYGNLSHAKKYTQDLFNLIELYQTHYPNPHPEIQEEIEAMELEFLQEDLPKLLNSMKVGANRIENIVKSLRNFSRLDESGHKKTNLHEGINSTLTILDNRINRRHNFPAIEIVKNYGNLPPVECYPGELNQVFINIISNAIDAIEEKDPKRTTEQIKLEPSLIEISTKIVGKFVQICIRDNGTGIPPEVKERLFDPFFTTKDVGKGTGLGLSICYEIVVEKHGGSLKCNSNPGKGTEFVMKIPMKLIPFQ